MSEVTKTILSATFGEFRTLDGVEYTGPYCITSEGLPRVYSEGGIITQVLVPYAKTPLISQSELLTTPPINNQLDENDTFYDLMPIIINQPPVIIKTLLEATQPPIKPIAVADGVEGFMYESLEGVIKVQKGATIVLKVEAQQPDILNVENGQLVIKPTNAELFYRWTSPTEITGNQPIDILNSQSGVILDKNTITISNIQPEFSGYYSCIVSNDVGSTDAGAITIEVFDAQIDSLFYSNLIVNPNADDDTDNWESIDDSFSRKSFKDPLGESLGLQLKSIVTDPFSSPDNPFGWTINMLDPTPYNLLAGPVRQITPLSPLEVSDNYFTRIPYTYTINKGKAVSQAYQDIDLTLLADHMKGAIHGISGLRAIFCAYVGNGIFNYEPNDEFPMPAQRSNSGSYYLGAARLSLQNFTKAGPGFVKEKVTVTLEEYANNQPIKSRIVHDEGSSSGSIHIGTPTLQDPWTELLPKYKDQIYYQGGSGVTPLPDGPSLGDNRDAHLFVADELMPDQEERYAYGQYAKFQKVIIDKLDHRTTKVRITITVEAPDLSLFMRDRGTDQIPTDKGKLWEVLPWTTTWPSRSLGLKNVDGYPNPSNIFNKIVYNSKKPLIEKLPRIGESRAMVTGLGFVIIPIVNYNSTVTAAEISQALITNPVADKPIVKSPISINPAYNAGQELEAAAQLQDEKPTTVSDDDVFYKLILQKYVSGELRDVIESSTDSFKLSVDFIAGTMSLRDLIIEIWNTANVTGNGLPLPISDFVRESYGIALKILFTNVGIDLSLYGDPKPIADIAMSAFTRIPADSNNTIFSLVGIEPESGGEIVTDGSDAVIN